MNKTNLITIGALVFAVIALSVGLLVRAPVVNVQIEPTSVPMGGAAGTEHYFLETFHSGLIVGGEIRATSTNDTTATFLASDFDVEKIVNFTPNITGITATLPASSTMPWFLPIAGQHKEILLCNATTTAGISFTLAAGAGTTLLNASSTTAILSGDCATLDFYRKATKDSAIDYWVFFDLGY